MFKKRKPSTPSLRHMFILVKNLSKKPLLKTKIKHHKKALGKSKSSGQIVAKHRERGAKKRFRVVNFDLSREMEEGKVCSIEHDPYRSAFIMAVFDSGEKEFFYSLAPEGAFVGQTLTAGKKVFMGLGTSTLLSRMPVGSFVSNVSLNPRNPKGKLSRSAGTFCILRGRIRDKSVLQLRSGEIRLVSSRNYAVAGRVSNRLHYAEESGKAGRSRWLGKRPRVRGVAMNPVDHPNGGGEGKKSGAKKTPWGKPSQGNRVPKHKVSKFVLKKRYG